MRTFKNIATLVKNKRIEHPENLSQMELSNLLGFKCDRLISNIEKAECNVPLKVMPKLSQILNIDKDDFIQAVLADHDESLDNYFNKINIQKTMYH